MLKTVCTQCKKGIYKEMSLYDDLEGYLTCERCGHRIPKYDKERTNNMDYFIIYINEDGEPYLNKYTKEEVSRAINDLGSEIVFTDKLPKYGLDSSGGKAFLIKGELVVPKPKERVVEWEIE